MHREASISPRGMRRSMRALFKIKTFTCDGICLPTPQYKSSCRDYIFFNRYFYITCNFQLDCFCRIIVLLGVGELTNLLSGPGKDSAEGVMSNHPLPSLLQLESTKDMSMITKTIMVKVLRSPCKEPGLQNVPTSSNGPYWIAGPRWQEAIHFQEKKVIFTF